MPAKDSLFASPLGEIDRFKFNQAVVDVFPDMLRRSVPGYESIITQSALLASRYVQPETHLYDLGSSLGATAISMRDALISLDPTMTQGCEIHAIDNSADMVKASRQVIAESLRHFNISVDSAAAKPEPGNSKPSLSARAESVDNGVTPVIVHEADLESHPLENASVVAMNFTLQFIDVHARAALMKKIADALQPGGAFILSEKVCFSDAVVNEMHIDMYHAFKSANGYSDLEISQKRTALENVLVPDTLSTHHERLLEAGFARVSVWFQCFNFASLIAIR